jgi:nitroimidazol reductase NimA-like FMN-containing flavoprotein (pyridoxamine 5'-phosphate oxidase superfamily)
VSRRDQIKMSPEEIDEFLHGRHTMNVATYNHDGSIHLVAMWYGYFDDGSLGFWTYGRSQKILNLQRDARMTCLVETGEEYAQLKGVEIVGQGIVVEDRDEVMQIGKSVFERYTGPWSDAAAPAVEQMGAKRHAVKIEVGKLVTWDHTKLGGVY